MKLIRCHYHIYQMNAYHIVESVENDNNRRKSFGLLPKLLISLKHSQQIELELIERESMNGREFQEFILETLSITTWKIQ